MMAKFVRIFAQQHLDAARVSLWSAAELLATGKTDADMAKQCRELVEKMGVLWGDIQKRREQEEEA